MSPRAFVDTNIWVYAVDTGEPPKRARALEVLGPGEDKDYVLSAQVLGEFYTTVTGKLKNAVSGREADAYIERMKQLPVVPIDVALVEAAIAGSRAWGVSYWDALILAAATAGGCSVVISEDLADGATYGSVRILNPFGPAGSGTM
jgi:predicted nucleic acid-binding protein